MSVKNKQKGAFTDKADAHVEERGFGHRPLMKEDIRNIMTLRYMNGLLIKDAKKTYQRKTIDNSDIPKEHYENIALFLCNDYEPTLESAVGIARGFAQQRGIATLGNVMLELQKLVSSRSARKSDAGIWASFRLSTQDFARVKEADAFWESMVICIADAAAKRESAALRLAAEIDVSHVLGAIGRVLRKGVGAEHAGNAARLACTLAEAGADVSAIRETLAKNAENGGGDAKKYSLLALGHIGPKGQ
jgi:hypothetical protein